MIELWERLRTHCTGIHRWDPSLKMTLMADTSMLRDSSGHRYWIKPGRRPLDFPHWEHSFEPLHVPFAPFSRSLLHPFTLGQNFEHLTISGGYLGYRHAIAKRIPPLDYPHWECSFGLLKVPFALFSRSLLHTFKLGWKFESLTIPQVTLGYRHAIAKQIPPLDPPYRCNNPTLVGIRGATGNELLTRVYWTYWYSLWSFSIIRESILLSEINL